MRLLQPDRYYTSIHAVDLTSLREAGIDALLIDLDNTLLPRDTNLVPEEVCEWAARLEEMGFRACLVSNNWHERVFGVARQLGFELVPKALKPFPWAFRRGMRLLDATPRRTAVVGDQLFTDVLGGRLVGCTTVLVDPLSRTDLPHTLLLRLIEARIMADRQPTA